MELGVILTYFGLLFTAYSATQELQRVKLRLIPKIFKILFFIFSIILFVTSFKEFRNYLLSYNEIALVIDYSKTHFYFTWQLKYFVLLILHIVIIIFSVTYFTKLRNGNQKRFFNLLIDLSKQENYKILNEIINENVLKVISLKSKRTYLEKYKNIKLKELLNKYKTKQDFDFNEKYIKKPIFCILKIFSFDKNIINEIDDFINTEPNIKSNELLGFEWLKLLIKNKSFNDNFIEKYLKNLFQNQDSYIVKQILDENNKNEYNSIIFKNSVNLKLNNVIGLAIIEFLKEDSDIPKELLEKYNGSSKKTIYIATLIDLFPKNSSYFTNTPIFIKKELLMYSKLDMDIETNGFYLFLNLLENIFEYIKKYYQINTVVLKIIKPLYNFGNIEKICDSKKIKIVSEYLDFLLEDNIPQKDKFDHFKDVLYDNENLKEFFILAMNNSNRNIGKDYLEYGIYDKGKERKLTRWTEICNILNNKKVVNYD